MTNDELINTFRTLSSVDDAAFGKVVKTLLGVALSPQVSVPVPRETRQTPAPEVRIVIRQGHVCSCVNCKVDVYQVISDVVDNMNTQDFMDCFEPMKEGVPYLDKSVSIWADPGGNLAINCPLCKGNKTLWIKGLGEPFDMTPEGNDGGFSGVKWENPWK
jgi:hypothetical protein